MSQSIQITETSPLLHDANCVYCHVNLNLGDHAVVCDGCQSPHHADCWRVNGDRCSTFGCTNSGFVTQSYMQPAGVRIVRTATVAEALHNRRRKRTYRPVAGPRFARSFTYSCTEISVLPQYDEHVSSVSWSQTGEKNIAVSSESGTVRIWGQRAYLRSPRLGSPDGAPHVLQSTLAAINSVQWSPDGNMLAIAHRNSTIVIWDMIQGRAIQSLDCTQKETNSGPTSNVSWSPDGSRIACGSSLGITHIWDVSTGEERQSLACHEGEITSLSWSPDGRKLLSGSRDNSARVWDLDSGHVLAFLGRNNAVTCVAWSPDSRSFAFGCDDATIHICNTQYEREVEVFHGQEASISSISWSPSGTFLVSGSKDTTVRVWHISRKEIVPIMQRHRGSVNSVSWSPDGRYLVSGSSDKTVRIWRIVGRR